MHTLFCNQILCTCVLPSFVFRHVIVKYMVKKKNGERSRLAVAQSLLVLENKNNYNRFLGRALRPLGLGVAVRLVVVAYRHHGDGDVFVGHTVDLVVAVAATAAAAAATNAAVKQRTGLEQCRLFVNDRLPVGFGSHGQLVPGDHSHRGYRIADTLDKHIIHTVFRTPTFQDGQKGTTNTP